MSSASPALGRHGAVAQVGQKLFQHRHLLGQLFGHPVAGGLVAVIHLVAERGGPQVERHGHLVGVALLEQGEQDIQKAINGVGIAAVLGGQQLDAKKNARLAMLLPSMTSKRIVSYPPFRIFTPYSIAQNPPKENHREAIASR